MPISRRLTRLKADVARLQKEFIPPLHPLGMYSQDERDNCSAFRLLAHAEIEAYLEDSAFETAQKALLRWHRKPYASRVLLGLLGFSTGEQPGIPADTNRPVEFMDERIDRAFREYRHFVKVSNNGIRRFNVYRLLLSVGIPESDINTVWLATIDAFGRDRGRTAHSSHRTMQLIDPPTETATVKDIIDGLDLIDQLLIRLR